ncbi:MAG: biosynthetic-type acetolactate synthase large subunit [Deltaproteobacteria bacterium]|nr:biosynthetic-type acetolactate synthase large subunit [Deltaproteobacteria bacterium]
MPDRRPSRCQPQGADARDRICAGRVRDRRADAHDVRRRRSRARAGVGARAVGEPARVDGAEPGAAAGGARAQRVVLRRRAAARRHRRCGLVLRDDESPGVDVNGAQILWEALRREGVEVVFGYPGGAIMPAYDALLESPIRHVLVRHEQGAAHMADGYARVSGKVGVAIATSGPGATNLVTGIATAMLDSVPLVCITGQVAGKLLGSDAFQEIDITGVTLPITKHNYLVTRADDIARTIREAFYLARSGRPGPVLVDITKDAQQATAVPVWSDAPVRMRGYRPEHRAELDDIARAVELIDHAKRPVILAGHGIVKAEAGAQLRQLVDRTGIPVASTLLGLGGFPATDPLSLGMMGMHGEAWVNHAIQEADLLIALGMRFDDRVTGKLETYAVNARKIHCELDPAEINKNVRVDVALVGDVRETLQALLPLVARRDRGSWLARIAEFKGDASVRDIQTMPHDGRLFAAHVMHDLWRITEGRALVVTDVGQHQMWEAQYYKHDHPRKLVTSGGLGTMGFALPAAIGAKLASPDDEVWVIAGDGGFQMTACELATIAQEGIKLHIAIINNGYLGMVRQWQQFFYDRRYSATPLRSPDFVKLAEAHELTGLRVTTRDDLATAVAFARAAEGTVVIDFRVEQEDSVYPMVPAGAALHDMIRRPTPLIETAQDE